MVEFNPPPGRAMESVAGRYRQLPTLLAGFRDDAIVPAPSVAPFQPPATVEDLLERCGGRWLSLRTLVTISDGEEGWDQSESAQLEFSWQPMEEGGGVATPQDPAGRLCILRMAVD